MNLNDLPKREHNPEEGILTVGQLRAYLDSWRDDCVVTMEKSGLHFAQVNKEANATSLGFCPVPLMHDGITIWQLEDLLSNGESSS